MSLRPVFLCFRGECHGKDGQSTLAEFESRELIVLDTFNTMIWYDVQSAKYINACIIIYLRGLCRHTASYAPVDSQEFWPRQSDQVRFSGMRNVGLFIRKARQADSGRIFNEFDSLTVWHVCFCRFRWAIKQIVYDCIFEGSLNSKLPTIWRVEKQMKSR